VLGVAKDSAFNAIMLARSAASFPPRGAKANVTRGRDAMHREAIVIFLIYFGRVGLCREMMMDWRRVIVYELKVVDAEWI
jgi:hypothetical protein